MSSTLTPPRERLDRGEGTGLSRPWLVIVLNDDHNTFQGVAFALSTVVPGVSYDDGMQLANRIHASGQAIDFRVPGKKAEVVRWLIANHHSGGVMTYSDMNHIHVDVGPRFVALNRPSGRT